MSNFFSSAPFTKSSTQVLTLKNTSQGRQAFKVKTTAPKLYFVRPNTSIINPGETAEVAVIIQPFKEDPPADYQCNDKFLVMSTAIANNNPITTASPEFSSFWNNDAPEFKEQVTNKKVRVRYVFDRHGEPAAHHTDGDAEQSVPAPSLTTENSAPVPAHSTESTAVPVTSPVSKKSAASETKPQQPPSYTQLDQDASLQESLEKAQLRIRTLLNELEEQKSITSVKVSSSNKNSAMARPATGVPLPQAALLVLVAFLVGWFFF